MQWDNRLLSYVIPLKYMYMYLIGERDLLYEWYPVTQQDYNGVCNLKEMWNHIHMGGKGI